MPRGQRHDGHGSGVAGLVHLRRGRRAAVARRVFLLLALLERRKRLHAERVAHRVDLRLVRRVRHDHEQCGEHVVRDQ